MPVVSVVLAGLMMRSRAAIRLGLRIACIRTPTRDRISSLLTLDPRFEGVRIQCADTVRSSTIGPGADWGGKVARELLSDRPTQYTARGPLSTRRASHSIHGALPTQCIARIDQSVAYLEKCPYT